MSNKSKGAKGHPGARPLYTRAAPAASGTAAPPSAGRADTAARRAAPLPAGTRPWALSIFRLSFPQGLLLSRGRPDSYEAPLPLLRADSLKSALLAAALPLFPELREPATSEAWLAGFTLSSGFPFATGLQGQVEYFFPKPQLHLPAIEGLKQEEAGKPTKKIAWLGQRYFEQLLRDEGQSIATAHLHDGGRFVSEKLAAATVVTRPHQQPHVFVPRGGGLDAVPYYTESLYFGPGAGLWFGVAYAPATEATVRPRVEAALRLLTDQGLGTDKHLGRGHFTAQADTLILSVPAAPTHWLNLGPWCPTRAALPPERLAAVHTAYGLTRHGGYLASPAQEDLVRLRKKSVYMFDEGSVFGRLPGEADPPAGALHDLQPADFVLGHPVWRDGRPLWVGCVPTEAKPDFA